MYFIIFPHFRVWPLLSRIFVYPFLVQQTFIRYILPLEIQFEQLSIFIALFILLVQNQKLSVHQTRTHSLRRLFQNCLHLS